MSYYQYIDPRELAEIFQQDTIAIIDVRDEDFDENGYIPTAVNVPSERWDDDNLIDNLISSHEGKEKVIFHCKMSQVRGPSCATRYIERRVEITGDESTGSKPEVMVLAGGYRRWRQLYAETPGMIITNKG